MSRTRGAGLASAAFALAIVMLGTTLPTPLYARRGTRKESPPG